MVTTSTQGGRSWGRPLLKEKLAANAIRKSDHDVGTSAGSAERAVGNKEVIANEVELGVACLGEEHFLRIGDDHLTRADAYDFLRYGGRHGAGYLTLVGKRDDS